MKTAVFLIIIWILFKFYKKLFKFLMWSTLIGFVYLTYHIYNNPIMIRNYNMNKMILDEIKIP